ncbi:protein MEI [Salix suchowensis]|nr:protein MEI [Salix suchowensis]
MPHPRQNTRSPSKIPVVNSSKKVGTGAWGIPLRTDARLFSSSLPVLPHEKLNFHESENGGQSIDDSSPNLNKLDLETEVMDLFEDIESSAIGNLLPNDDELLAGIMDDFDLSGLPSQVEDLEECDFFGPGGGMELDFESQESLRIGMSKLNMSDGIPANGVGHYPLPNGVGTVAGEHPYGEHPSRTLFVRNINSNVEDSELKSLFEQYGDIRTLYTACKHRGFVMISYYDIRDARTAMRALQNKPLRRRKLDIHFSIPKDNPSEKDINQGTLVVFNLDASVSNDDLRLIFGVYGEVKEIRETPHKRHHKFIEFYDVRAAEAALRALNKSDIAGKRIKLEPSRPGGARRNMMQQITQELEQDEVRSFRHQVGSPVGNSPPGAWAQFGSPVEHSPLHGFSKSPGLGTLSPVNGNNLPGLASILPPHLSNPAKITPIGKDHGRVNHVNQMVTNFGSMQGAAHQHSCSFTDQKLSTSPIPTSNSSGIGTLTGPHASSAAWPTSTVGNAFPSRGQGQAFPYTSRHGSLLGSHHHHVGSAPSGLPLDRHFGIFPESPETSFMNQVALGGMGLNRSTGNYMMNMGGCAAVGSGIGLPGPLTENGSPGYRVMSFPRHNPMFMGAGSYSGPVTIGNEGFVDRVRSRRVENIGSQIDCKKQYQLDLEKIINGEDTRTTLMIKNIPNKYTSKMLLASIDEIHRGTYDFLYLPIDFKNKCNVGYAFINMVSPSHIISFYEAFNGKRWEKFNSEKVASLAYARIQGKSALVTHFQNSSLMNEDKRCRPILFHSEGQEATDQEPFLSGNLNICIRQPDGSYFGDSFDSPEDSLDEKPEKN